MFIIEAYWIVRLNYNYAAYNYADLFSAQYSSGRFTRLARRAEWEEPGQRATKTELKCLSKKTINLDKQKIQVFKCKL